MDAAIERAMGSTGILPQAAFPPSMVVMASQRPRQGEPTLPAHG